MAQANRNDKAKSHARGVFKVVMAFFARYHHLSRKLHLTRGATQKL